MTTINSKLGLRRAGQRLMMKIAAEEPRSRRGAHLRAVS